MKNKVLVFLATGFGAGYAPCTPGTFGTLVGMGIVFGEYLLFGTDCIYANVVLLLVMVIPSIFIAGRAEIHFGEKDAQQIVIDEMVGYWLSIFMQPFSIKLALVAFVLFRFFDILKPFPVSISQNIKGGAGVVADDLIAGLYVNASLLFLSLVLNHFWAGIL
jgi:phosphatidylglycerophosphatase A